MITRVSCGIQYGVDPSYPSDIYLDENTIQQVLKSGHELSIYSFSSYLRTLNSEYVPVLLNWDMTSKCNFSCEFCYIKDNSLKEDVSFYEAKVIIDQLIEVGLFEAYLSGGECLLVRDFIDIYSYLKLNGIFVTVFTNGALINEELLNCWAKLPPSSVEITLYSNDFSSVPYVNILKLKDMGIHLALKFTLAQNTKNIYPDVMSWASRNGFELFVDSELFDGVDEQHEKIDERFGLTITEKKELNPKRYTDEKHEFNTRSGFPCKSKNGTLHIDPDFNMALCNQMKTRLNLREKSFKESLFELKKIIKKYEHSELIGCSGCLYASKCDMCFANAIVKNDELYVPDGHCKKIMEKYINF